VIKRDAIERFLSVVDARSMVIPVCMKAIKGYIRKRHMSLKSDCQVLVRSISALDIYDFDLEPVHSSRRTDSPKSDVNLQASVDDIGERSIHRCSV